jgi:hypothetical protein
MSCGGVIALTRLNSSYEICVNWLTGRVEIIDMDALPTAIMLTLRDATSERVLSISTVAPVHVNAPARSGKSGGPSDDVNDAKDDGKIGGGTPKQGGS